jgi:hypothetical protein
MAKAYPNVVRHAYREGHTIATHSARTPSRHLPVSGVGPLSGGRAISRNARRHGVECRFSGRRLEAYLGEASHGARTGVARTQGPSILHLHDIHPATARALPGLLRELQARHFHIVHVVSAATVGQSGH